MLITRTLLVLCAVTALLALPSASSAPEWGRALFGAGILAYAQGDLATAQHRFEAALDADARASESSERHA